MRGEGTRRDVLPCAVRKPRQVGKSAQEALAVIRTIKPATKSECERECISAVQSVIEWDFVPEYYIKRIAKMTISSGMIKKIRTVLPESYVDTVIYRKKAG